MTLQLDCNRCNCRNGVLFCTRRTCEDDDDGDDDDSDSDNDDSDSDDDSDGDEPEEERNCHACGFMPENPVWRGWTNISLHVPCHELPRIRC